MSQRDTAAERLERAISHARGYAVIVLDNEGRIGQWNPGAAEIFGYSEEEALGMDGAALFTREDVAREVPAAELEQARAGGQASDRRWQRRKDDSVFFADGVTIAALHDDGRVDGFVKILRDATTEKRREEHLSQIQAMAEIAYSSQEVDQLLADLMDQLCRTFDSDTAAVLLTDDSGRRLEVRAARGLQVELDTLPLPFGHGFAGAIAARNAPLVWNDPPPDRFVMPSLRARRLRAIMGVPLAVDGRVIGVVHVGTERQRTFGQDDLNLLQLAGDRISLALENARLFDSERKSAEQSAFLSDAAALLASSLDYERTLAEVARVAVPRLADWCAVDLVDEQGVVRRVAAEHVDPSKVALAHEFYTRYPPARDAAGGIYHIVRTGNPELVPVLTDAMIRGAAVDQEHYRLIRELGLHSYMAVPLAVRGQIFGVVSFVWAESKRTYTQEDLDFAQQLGSRAALAIENARLYREARLATHARDAFLAMLSHELRTPMTSILGWVSLLQEGSLDEETRKLGVESIEQSARLQAHLIEDLLDISRTVAGKLRLERTAADMAEVTSDAVTTLQPQAAAAGVRVITDVPPSGAAVVEGDAKRLQQILGNLLSNGIKFTPRGGLVTVRVTTDASDVSVCVTDTGRGIPRGILSHVFDPFRQAEGMDHRSFGGLGLGLAIVRTLVQLHGGSVMAESEGDGKGASFTVKLPRIRAQQTPRS